MEELSFDRTLKEVEKNWIRKKIELINKLISQLSKTYGLEPDQIEDIYVINQYKEKINSLEALLVNQ